MSLFSRLLRYATFLLSFAGIVMIISVLQTLRSQESGIIAPPPIAPPTKPYDDTVAATGILEALSENVSIGVPVSGLVTEVAVKVNDFAKEGQPLFKLDDRELQASLIKQRAMVAVAVANITVEKATLNKMQDMLDRMTAVTDARAISQDDLKNRANDVSVTKAQLQAGEAQFASAQADVKQSEMLLERLIVRDDEADQLRHVIAPAG